MIENVFQRSFVFHERILYEKMTELKTERLLLRPARTDDVPAVYELWTDPDVRRYLWDDTITPLEEVKKLIAESEETLVSSGLGIWLIHTQEGSFVGFCGLREADYAQPGDVELLYGLYPQYWALGYATEASARLLRYTFEKLNLPRVVAAVDTPNVASGRVLERLGMKHDRTGDLDGMPTEFYVLDAEAFRSDLHE